MDRTINVTVTGEFVRKDSKNAGVQGEANVTGLHIVMSDDWEAFSKRIIWRNALGESPVAVLLYNSVEDLVAKKDPLTFDTAIPAEPLALEGWCSFTIEGFRESNPTAVAITVTDHLLVKPNDAYTTPKEPTPTQAQQLQTQINGIVPQVSTLVGNAIEALEQAEEAVKVWEAYDSAKTYLPLQKVSRLGSSYICKAACKGVAPELDVAGGVEGAHWLLIASKGDQGEQGAEGPQGKTGKQGIQGCLLYTSQCGLWCISHKGHFHHSRLRAPIPETPGRTAILRIRGCRALRNRNNACCVGFCIGSTSPPTPHRAGFRNRHAFSGP